jgi:hypothetical protein
LDAFLEENLATGKIRPSKSEIASPIFFVKKKTGDLRPTIDYRAINDQTRKNKYPLPLIRELFDKLKNAKIFTKMDVQKGFNNIRMKEGDEYKAAFRTNKGLFEPLVMFFGLCNSPATFQTFMDQIFHIEIRDGFLIVYMDDILIFSEDMETHTKAVKRALQILKENNLCAKPEKCEFHKSEIEFLGLIVGNGNIRMDPGKVEAIKKWESPKNKKDLQTFLGFANFYR